MIASIGPIALVVVLVVIYGVLLILGARSLHVPE